MQQTQFDLKASAANNWSEVKSKKYIFPIVCSSDAFNIALIHPLMQRAVLNIYDTICLDTRVASVTVFGSSTNLRCNKHSDVDLLIELKDEYKNTGTRNEVSEKIQESCMWKADIIWADRLTQGSRILENASKGVRIV